MAGMVTPPSMPDWAKINQSGDWMQIKPALEQESLALSGMRQNQSLAEMLYRQQQEKHPLEMQSTQANIEQSRAAARASNASAATSEDALKALPPLEQRQALALIELRSKHGDAGAKLMDSQFSMLGGAIAAAAANGGRIPLQMQEGLNPDFRQLLSQPGGVKAAQKLLSLYSLSQPKQQQRMQEVDAKNASDERQNQARIAAANDRASAALQNRIALADKKIQDALGKQSETQLAAGLISQIANLELMIEMYPEKAAELTPKLQSLVKAQEKLQADRLARTPAPVAQERLNQEVDKSALGVPTVGANRTANQAGAIKPNPAAAMPNNTDAARQSTHNYKTEADAQKAGAAGKFKKGDIIYIGGKPVKVE